MAKKKSSPHTGSRSPAELTVRQEIAKVFDDNRSSTDQKLENFPKYINRQMVTRYLALYEIFKLILETKGSIIDCGVHEGFSSMAWANFSAVLEPANFTRRIYGFDTFKGFPSVSKKDRSATYTPPVGELACDSYDELNSLATLLDKNRFLGHIPKLQLVKGPVDKTMPKFLKDNPHLVVSLLFLDFDIYEPTKIAIKNFLPRMPKGSVIAFDQLDYPTWPGETQALADSLGIGSLNLKRFSFDPCISYAVLE